ncbi:hypothetical protein CRM22_003629 [Opisthorchis felineus]|uniref:Fibrous sheath-interacting protein 1 n=2 Tax=Opisthorchis felineus TaxID=147828 RepID=A0A4S2M6G6_OPIFE|nr:hypothetical protein CRM22_003629 [Opisthorchis felineus]TGZ69635.1 hypothetical protein CRM22_003629 [Opisthorchis felineus]TGZ69636.1 hypothetical protein CRM22_003629 [Opisthorchis felineus]TGZ69637.1 hypothetical protein CRM22_003629 [Opisthorchis felineus]
MDQEDDSFTSFFTELQFAEAGQTDNCNEHILLDKLRAKTEALDQLLLEGVKKENKVKQQSKVIHQRIRQELMQIVVRLTESTTNQRSGKRQKSYVKSSISSPSILPNLNTFLDKSNALVSVPICDNALVPSYKQNEILRNIKCFLDLDRAVFTQADHNSNLSEDEQQTMTDEEFHMTETGSKDTSDDVVPLSKEDEEKLEQLLNDTEDQDQEENHMWWQGQEFHKGELPSGADHFVKDTLYVIEDNQIPLPPRDELALWPSPKAGQLSLIGSDPEIEKLQERLKEIDQQLQVFVMEKEEEHVSLPHISSTNVCDYVREVSEERKTILESDGALFYEMDGIEKELVRLT